MKSIKLQLKFTKIIKIILILIIIYCISIITLTAAKSFGFNYVTQTDNIEEIEPFSILLAGGDTGGGRTIESDGLRTDALMLATFSPNNSRGNIEMNVTSIPRDMVVYIPVIGAEAKINSAFNYGYDQNGSTEEGMQSLVDTVEYLFDIPIDYYLLADFDSLISIIDSVDGIDVFVQYSFCEQDEFGNADAYCFEEGQTHMGGSEALAYARQRHYSSDYERGQRQQVIVIQTILKVLSNPEEYADNFGLTLYNSTLNNIDLNLITQLINYSSQLYNDIMQNLSSGIPVYLDIKTSDYSNQTGFSVLNSVSDYQINSSIYTADDLYETYSPFEEDYIINRYFLTKNILNIPSTPTSNSKEMEVQDPIIIELQVIDTAVIEQTQNSLYGSHSLIDQDAQTYISDLFNQTLQ